MRPSHNRVPFDRSQYPAAFLRVVDECHLQMINHHGRVREITNREWTVEMQYLFPKVADGQTTSPSEENVVLNVSHDKSKRFTKHHFSGAAAKPFQYQSLKEDIDRVARKHARRNSKTAELSTNGVEAGEMTSEIRRTLEQLNCTQIDLEVVSYGVKFTGGYNEGEFRFIVHFMKDEEFKSKSWKKQRVVWEVPQPVPPTLHRKVLQVVGGEDGSVDELTEALNAAQI